MGHRRHLVHSSSRQYLSPDLFSGAIFNQIVADTPWDEPTQHSPEYSRYLSGEIFAEAPWNRLGEVTLCK